MNVQILVSTMKQNDFSLLDKLNIQSNAIIINQTSFNSERIINYKGYKIEWYDVNERGLSRSRNLALSKATGDVCLLVDDDEILRDGYVQIITNNFQKKSDATVVAFNLNSIGNKSMRYVNKANRRLKKYNALRYGSARLAFQKKSIISNHISFRNEFGAGAFFSSGEDSIFLSECLNKGLKIYSSVDIIADIVDDDGTSTWFKGYDNKYFYDKGAVYCAISKKLSKPFIIYFLIKHYPKYYKSISIIKAYRSASKGAKKYSDLLIYPDKMRNLEGDL